MNTGEVYDLFRSMIDEPDDTFLSKPQAQSMCDMGYREFRQVVSDTMPDAYNTVLSVSVSGREHELAGVLFRDALGVATHPCQRIIRIGADDGSGNLAWYMTPGQNPTQVDNLEVDYCLVGTRLVFSENTSRTIRIEYVPETHISPGAWTSGDLTFIDTFDSHHALIALYAARYYMVRDGAPNNALLSLMQEKERLLESYLAVGRATDGSHYIAPAPGYNLTTGY